MPAPDIHGFATGREHQTQEPHLSTVPRLCPRPTKSTQQQGKLANNRHNSFLWNQRQSRFFGCWSRLWLQWS